MNRVSLATITGLILGLALVFGSFGDMLIVGLLAVAMGMRTVTVRRLGISDVSTTVLTSTLASLASDTLFRGAPFRAGGVSCAPI